MTAPSGPAEVPAPAPKLVIVDTNCIVRIYFSPLRPILGAPAAGYLLKTINDVAGELKNLAGRSDLAWLTDPVIHAEVDAAKLELTRLQASAINQDAPGIRTYGNSHLKKYCTERAISDRFVSLCDSKLLSTALELKAALATDEWPLRAVAQEYDDDDGNPIELLSSVDLLSILEKDGRLRREDRISTYASWIKDGTNLLRGSDTLYASHFGEPPPDGQH